MKNEYLYNFEEYGPSFIEDGIVIRDLVLWQDDELEQHVPQPGDIIRLVYDGNPFGVAHKVVNSFKTHCYVTMI